MHVGSRVISSKLVAVTAIKLSGYRGCVALPNLAIRLSLARRLFATSTQRCRDKIRASEWNAAQPLYHPPLARLTVPDVADQKNPRAWVAILNKALPYHLKDEANHNDQEDLSEEVDATDFAYFLIRSQASGVDVLRHLALGEGRWNSVLFIVRAISQLQASRHGLQTVINSTSRQSWLKNQGLSEIVESPILAHKIDTDNTDNVSLQELTASEFDTSNSGWNMRRGALGQIWRSLGSLILAAIHQSGRDSVLIMDYVRQMLAILHHADVVPQSVYAYVNTPHPFSSRQPPILQLLSGRIFDSLSDAAWNAHQASVTASAIESGIRHDSPIHSAPGSMYKVQVMALGPEIWLELVLWSCLHGPWVIDGVAILKELSSHTGTESWCLLSWTDMLHSYDIEELKDFDLLKMKSRLDARNPRLEKAEHQEDRVRVQRTVSTEVVTAFVDGLINVINVGVGARGLPLHKVLEDITILKSLLDRSSMSLGRMSWDGAIVRILESQGVMMENASQATLLNITKLAQPFSVEGHGLNTPSLGNGKQRRNAYFMDSTAVSLGMFHQVIQLCISRNDVTATLKAFRRLQTFTDKNKAKSIKQFTRTIQTTSNDNDNQDDLVQSGSLLAGEFPNFYPRLSHNILASLLDLVTRSGALEFGRWLIYSNDVDGPMISIDSYSHPSLAAALVRFATAIDDKTLMTKVLSAQFQYREGKAQKFQLSGRILFVFLESQVEARKWDSVTTLLKRLQDRDDTLSLSLYAAVIARELIRISVGKDIDSKTSLTQGQEIFRAILKGTYGRVTKREVDSLLGVVAVLSTINDTWMGFCTPFLVGLNRRILNLSSRRFEIILQGIVDAHGCLAGIQAFKKWCNPSILHRGRLLRQEFGVQRIPFPHQDAAKSSHVVRVPVKNGSEHVIFLGGVQAQISMIRMVLQGGLKGKQKSLCKQDENELVQWAVRHFWASGFDVDEIKEELDGLVQ